MLKKDWIRKEILIHTDDWFVARLAKFTASEFHVFMGREPFAQGAMSYIYRKVGEDLTGKPCRDEIFNRATEHGHTYEADCLRQLMKIKGLDLIITQQLISEPGSRFSCTPDALIIHLESTDGSSYNVSTVEGKCPISYDGYIKLALCSTPADIKKISPAYYWQVIFQMSQCSALTGYLVIFHPSFKFGSTRILEFRKLDLLADFTLLTQRKPLVEQMFNEVRDKLFTLQT